MIIAADFFRNIFQRILKSKAQKVACKKGTPLQDSKIRRDIRKAFEGVLIPLGKADQKLLPARMDMTFRKNRQSNQQAK